MPSNLLLYAWISIPGPDIAVERESRKNSRTALRLVPNPREDGANSPGE